MAVTKPKVVQPKRLYSADMEIDSDLFKFQVANMLKNIGYDDKKPVLQNVEHCHFFRTYDSNGRKQIKCSHVGGHTHVVEVEMKDDGSLTCSCSPAIGTKFNDLHTHVTLYVRSDKIKKRILNEEAQIQIARMEQPL